MPICHDDRALEACKVKSSTKVLDRLSKGAGVEMLGFDNVPCVALECFRIPLNYTIEVRWEATQIRTHEELGCSNSPEDDGHPAHGCLAPGGTFTFMQSCFPVADR